VNRNELHHELNQEYTSELGYGIEKISHPDYKNIWFVIPPPLPRSQAYLSQFPRASVLPLLSKARRVLNETKTFVDMDNTDHLLSFLIIRQEAVASSRIEGTFSTIDEAFSNPSLDAEVHSPHTLSVIGYARAMEQIIQKISKEKFTAISHELFRSLHKAIIDLDPSYEAIPGEYREEGRPGAIVQIGGLRRREESTYNPAPPRHVPTLMNNFIEWLSSAEIQEEDDAGMGLPLPLRMAIGHAHFEAIHPFSDGNGRVGRMIWPMQMVLAGLSPLQLSTFIEANKDGYYDGLKAFQKQLDPLPLLDYIGDALNGSHLETQRTKEAILRLPLEWKKRLTARRHSTAERLLERLIQMPVFSAQEVMSQLKVTLPAALNALKQLQHDGIISEKSGRQRKQKFVADEVLAIVGRKYGTTPDEALTLLAERKKRT
jgi:Fic family protein